MLTLASQTSRLSAEAAPPARATSAASTSTSVSTAGLSKTALKKLETADRMRLREANTLRAGDKKVTTAELTVHISGTAFASPDDESSGEDSDDLYGDGGRKKKGKTARKKSKPSPWLEITRDVQERLKQYDCNVECPEVPRQDLGCEGAVRWTRLCDRMWSEERRMYVPLKDKERIVVEEDSRLIFLYVAISSSSSAHPTDIVAQNRPRLVAPYRQLYPLDPYRDHPGPASASRQPLHHAVRPQHALSRHGASEAGGVPQFDPCRTSGGSGCTGEGCQASWDRRESTESR
jgi:hypothetical protein